MVIRKVLFSCVHLNFEGAREEVARVNTHALGSTALAALWLRQIRRWATTFDRADPSTEKETAPFYGYAVATVKRLLAYLAQV